MRPKIRLLVIGPEEDAAILRCVIHHCGWAEPSTDPRECRAAFVITGTSRTPLSEATRALRRVRGLKECQIPVIALHRGFQGAAMVRVSLFPANIPLRGRLLLKEWDRNWAETIDAARVLTARKRGPKKWQQNSKPPIAALSYTDAFLKGKTKEWLDREVGIASDKESRTA